MPSATRAMIAAALRWRIASRGSRVRARSASATSEGFQCACMSIIMACTPWRASSLACLPAYCLRKRRASPIVVHLAGAAISSDRSVAQGHERQIPSVRAMSAVPSTASGLATYRPVLGAIHRGRAWLGVSGKATTNRPRPASWCAPAAGRTGLRRASRATANTSDPSAAAGPSRCRGLCGKLLIAGITSHPSQSRRRCRFHFVQLPNLRHCDG